MRIGQATRGYLRCAILRFTTRMQSCLASRFPHACDCAHRLVKYTFAGKVRHLDTSATTIIELRRDLTRVDPTLPINFCIFFRIVDNPAEWKSELCLHNNELSFLFTLPILHVEIEPPAPQPPSPQPPASQPPAPQPPASQPPAPQPLAPGGQFTVRTLWGTLRTFDI